MKNRNNQLTAILFVIAFALAPIVQCETVPDGGPPTRLLTRHRGLMVALPSLANDRVSANSEAIPEGENRPVITVHSIDNVKRGKTGSFVLDMHPLMFGGMYVNFSLAARLSQELITFSLCPRPTSDNSATE